MAFPSAPMLNGRRWHFGTKCWFLLSAILSGDVGTPRTWPNTLAEFPGAPRHTVADLQHQIKPRKGYPKARPEVGGGLATGRVCCHAVVGLDLVDHAVIVSLNLAQARTSIIEGGRHSRRRASGNVIVEERD